MRVAHINSMILAGMIKHLCLMISLVLVTAVITGAGGCGTEDPDPDPNGSPPKTDPDSSPPSSNPPGNNERSPDDDETANGVDPDEYEEFPGDDHYRSDTVGTGGQQCLANTEYYSCYGNCIAQGKSLNSCSQECLQCQARSSGYREGGGGFPGFGTRDDHYTSRYNSDESDAGSGSSYNSPSQPPHGNYAPTNSHKDWHLSPCVQGRKKGKICVAKRSMQLMPRIGGAGHISRYGSHNDGTPNYFSAKVILKRNYLRIYISSVRTSVKGKQHGFQFPGDLSAALSSHGTSAVLYNSEANSKQRYNVEVTVESRSGSSCTIEAAFLSPFTSSLYAYYYGKARCR